MAQAPREFGGDGAANFVRHIVSDPKNVPDVTLLSGYLGASSEDGHERLYLSQDLSSYVEIPATAILHRAAASRDQDPNSAVTLWVRKDAALQYKMAPAAQAMANYFAGAIAAGAQGAGVAPQVGPVHTVGACAHTVGACAPSVNCTLRCPTEITPCINTHANTCFCPVTHACPSQNQLCQSLGRVHLDRLRALARLHQRLALRRGRPCRRAAAAGADGGWTRLRRDGAALPDQSEFRRLLHRLPDAHRPLPVASRHLRGDLHAHHPVPADPVPAAVPVSDGDLHARDALPDHQLRELSDRHRRGLPAGHPRLPAAEPRLRRTAGAAGGRSGGAGSVLLAGQLLDGGLHAPLRLRANHVHAVPAVMQGKERARPAR